MEWYYAENNERRGPLAEADFHELVKAGRITPSTQVWHEGWTEWRELSAAGEIGTADGTSAALCVECHRSFPTTEMVQYSGSWVCPTCKPIFFQKVKEGIEPVVEMQYAGFWIRFLAKFVDGIILTIPGYILQFGGAALMPKDQAGIGLFVGWFFSMLLNVSYSTFLVGKYGATLGKMACGLRIVTAERRSVSYGTALGRFFAELVSAITLYIGYIMVAFDDEKRALHDRICNTRVIRSRA